MELVGYLWNGGRDNELIELKRKDVGVWHQRVHEDDSSLLTANKNIDSMSDMKIRTNRAVEY